jgi:hypothetical protein
MLMLMISGCAFAESMDIVSGSHILLHRGIEKKIDVPKGDGYFLLKYRKPLLIFDYCKENAINSSIKISYKNGKVCMKESIILYSLKTQIVEVYTFN